MVRRNELACRDEWSQNLWAPKEGGESAEPQFQRPPTTNPAPPANIDDMRALVGANTQVPSSDAEEGEDVLLSEGRIVSETHPSPARPEPPRSFPAGGFDPRTAVIRAREAYRERTRARESAARQSAGAEALAGSREEPTPREAAAEPFRAMDGERADERQADQAAPTPVEAERRAVPTGPTEFETPSHEEGGAERDAIPLVEWPVAEAGGTRAPQAAVTEPEWTIDGILDEGDGAQHVLADAEHEPELALEHLDQLDESNLPAWFQTDLPRVCRACRDYRPSSDGGRGWCANRWAFTHSRMVHEDDVAPCDSAIGDWWVPVDDVWLVAADVSSHGRATPLLDRLTARTIEQRRRS